VTRGDAGKLAPFFSFSHRAALSGWERVKSYSSVQIYSFREGKHPLAFEWRLVWNAF